MDIESSFVTARLMEPFEHLTVSDGPPHKPRQHHPPMPKKGTARVCASRAVAGTRDTTAFAIFSAPMPDRTLMPNPSFFVIDEENGPLSGACRF